jgi:hypothetical protein
LAVKSVEVRGSTLLSTAATGPGERKCSDHDESSDNELPSPRKILGAHPLEVGGSDSSDEESSDEASNLSWPDQKLATLTSQCPYNLCDR